MKTLKPSKVTKLQRRLFEEALAVRKRAQVKHSDFRVGAVVIDQYGTHHTGCNVESDSYGLTICAERAAIAKMAADGGNQVTYLCVVLEGGNQEGGSPCGACRQVIWDYSFGNKKAPILIGDLKGNLRLSTIGELLPDAFVFKKK